MIIIIIRAAVLISNGAAAFLDNFIWKNGEKTFFSVFGFINKYHDKLPEINLM